MRKESSKVQATLTRLLVILALLLASPGALATTIEGKAALCDRAYQDCKELSQKQTNEINGLKDALKTTQEQRDTAIARGDALVAKRGGNIQSGVLWQLFAFFLGFVIGVGSSHVIK